MTASRSIRGYPPGEETSPDSPPHASRIELTMGKEGEPREGVLASEERIGDKRAIAWISEIAFIVIY